MDIDRIERFVFLEALAGRGPDAPPWYTVVLLAGNVRDNGIEALVDSLPCAMRRHFSVKRVRRRAKVVTPDVRPAQAKGPLPPAFPPARLSIEGCLRWLAGEGEGLGAKGDDSGQEVGQGGPLPGHGGGCLDAGGNVVGLDAVQAARVLLARSGSL